mmetsp:Transcript_12405/g.27606  ORF Transcript_12405/g.27606 Transcript_12405/m.27606 type:complete len:236 (-) Transcript_12405:196-903(-)
MHSTRPRRSEAPLCSSSTCRILDSTMESTPPERDSSITPGGTDAGACRCTGTCCRCVRRCVRRKASVDRTRGCLRMSLSSAAKAPCSRMPSVASSLALSCRCCSRRVVCLRNLDISSFECSSNASFSPSRCSTMFSRSTVAVWRRGISENTNSAVDRPTALPFSWKSVATERASVSARSCCRATVERWAPLCLWMCLENWSRRTIRATQPLRVPCQWLSFSAMPSSSSLSKEAKM